MRDVIRREVSKQTAQVVSKKSFEVYSKLLRNFEVKNFEVCSKFLRSLTCFLQNIVNYSVLCLSNFE